MFRKVQKLQPLPQYLPFLFKNGIVIRQFSKPCLRCNETLHSQHMYGLIRPIDDYAALAAQATCPACGLQFNIACVINTQKEVRRVLLPALLFRWYLQVLPYTPRMPAPTQHMHQAPPVPSAVPPTFPDADKSIAVPAPPVHFERSEETVGQYDGKPIPAYIIIHDTHIPFARIATSTPHIQAGEYLVDGHLVYSKLAA